MATFKTDFEVRHRQALRTIADRIGIDYFQIDCAELIDGSLMLFEADVAAGIHALDPHDVYPYKRPQMRRIFEAFRGLLGTRRVAVY